MRGRNKIAHGSDGSARMMMVVFTEGNEGNEYE